MRKPNRLIAVLILQVCRVAWGVDSGDLYELEVDELDTPEAVAAAELQFDKVMEIQGLLANSRRCYRKVMYDEIRRLHESAKLQRKEFAAILADVELDTRKAVLDIGQDRIARIQLQRSGSSSGNMLGHLAPITRVENFVITAAERHLKKSRYAGYHADVLDRRKHRQRSVVEAITTSLDSRLFLSTAQREAVSQTLQREWHDPWLLCIRPLLSKGVEAIPLLPKSQIEEHLTETQIALFRRLAWNSDRSPYVGPAEVIMAGHRLREVRLVDQLKFESPSAGRRP